jgi:hypothetical protein
MGMFCFKKCKKEVHDKKVTEVKKEAPCLSKAEEIATQYKQLKECCEILSVVEIKKEGSMDSMHSGGWRVWQHTIENAGIDIEEVYQYIKLLTEKRKAELEARLEKVGA